MPLRWHIAGRPLVARRLLFGLRTFLLFQWKHTIWVFERTVSFKHPNLGFGCFPSIVTLCFRHSKEIFRRNSSFEHPKHMSVIFVYYRNCYFCCTKSVRLACSLNVHWSRINQRMGDDQIKINFSSFMPLIRHSKTSNKLLLQTTLIKDTIYSLNG